MRDLAIGLLCKKGRKTVRQIQPRTRDPPSRIGTGERKTGTLVPY